jgi:hypothetical protein
VLTRYGNEALSPYFADLGAYLELWSDLADQVQAGRAVQAGDLSDLVKDVARRVSSLPSNRSEPPPIFGVPGSERVVHLRSRGLRNQARPPPEAPTPSPVEHSRAPLRVAIAGPHTDGRTVEFSRATTAVAAQLGVGGRVVTGDAPDGTSSLGQLVDLPSPFGTKGSASTADLLRWFDEALAARADVVLLDFGAPTPTPMWEELIRSATKGRLVVAAGGISEGPVYPAWFPGILAVGALEADGTPARYSTYDPAAGKPEIFAPKTTDGSRPGGGSGSPGDGGAQLSPRCMW